MIVNTITALGIMRSGDGELSPIVEYYNRTGLEYELIDHLGDSEILSTILYVLSELSKVDSRVVIAVKALLSRGHMSDRDLAWSEEIIMNHG
jgi:hypothetical protein